MEAEISDCAVYLWESTRPIFRPAATKAEASKNLERGTNCVVGRRATTRNPLLLLRLSGWLLLRETARTEARLLFHEPPRKTRQSTGVPRYSCLYLQQSVTKKKDNAQIIFSDRAAREAGFRYRFTRREQWPVGY